MTDPVSRRSMMSALVVGSGSVACPAWALKRTRYGGQLPLSLPLDPLDIDPHDPHSLTTAVLGRALFETLYRRGSNGHPYPSLATSLPKERGSRSLIELRPQLATAGGQPVDAAYVVRSLQRAQKTSSALRELGPFRARGRDRIECKHPDARRVATTLSSARAALFDGALDGCGPFGVDAGTQLLRLQRNPRAARGGSYLDEVLVRRASVRQCLRDFEGGRSLVGFLGAGLYQSRGGAQTFALGKIGWVVVLVGDRLGEFGAPGVMQTTLRRIPPKGLQALGMQDTEPNRPGSWAGPPLSLEVDGAAPWLVAIAEEVARSLSAPGHEVTVRPQSSQALQRLRRSRRFDTMLAFVRDGGSTDPVHSAVDDLFSLDGTKPPRGQRQREMHRNAQRLRLGIVGSLAPHGAAAETVHHLVARNGLNLGNTTLNA